jgi:hypothetical protein
VFLDITRELSSSLAIASIAAISIMPRPEWLSLPWVIWRFQEVVVEAIPAAICYEAVLFSHGECTLAACSVDEQIGICATGTAGSKQLAVPYPLHAEFELFYLTLGNPILGDLRNPSHDLSASHAPTGRH